MLNRTKFKLIFYLTLIAVLILHFTVTSPKPPENNTEEPERHISKRGSQPKSYKSLNYYSQNRYCTSHEFHFNFTVPIHENQNCPHKSPGPITVHTARKPKYSLRTTHFLLPTLIGSPDEQKLGLIDSILLAVYLNRTLILPIFYKNKHDPTGSTTQSICSAQFAHHKINIKNLSELIPIAQYEDIPTVCPHADAIFIIREQKEHQIRAAYRAHFDVIGTSILKHRFENDGTLKDLAEHVVLPGEAAVIMEKTSFIYNEFPFKSVQIRNQPADLISVFGNKYLHHDTCAVLQASSRNILWHLDLNKNSKNSEFIKEIITSVTRPEVVVSIAEEFLNHQMKGRQFFAVHWKYDVAEFSYHCKEKFKKLTIEQRIAWKDHICKGVMEGNLNPEVVADHLIEFVKDKQNHADGYKILYIVAPPSDKDFLIKIGKSLKKKANVKVVHEKHLERFVEDRFKACMGTATWKDQIFDFYSQLEQEICLRSKLFIGSSQSSWTKTVHYERVARGVSGNDLSQNLFLLERSKADMDKVISKIKSTGDDEVNNWGWHFNS